MDISSSAYTDLNSLNQIKQLGKKDEAAAIKKISQQFESFFLQMMLKSMRDANSVFGKGNSMNTSEMEFHQNMLDQQMTLNLSQSENGMGLAKVLERQLSKQYGVRSAPKIDMPADKLIPLSKASLQHSASKNVGIELNQTKKIAPIKPAESVFHQPAQFIKELYSHAKEAADKIGAKAEVLLSQAALETGWGQHVMKDESGSTHNLFGIKADGRWQGEVVDKSSLEYEDGVIKKIVSPFRSYESFKQSFDDYISFLQDNPRYQQALKVASNPAAFTQALQDAGYATDPNYAKKIMGIIDSDAMRQIIKGG